MSSQNRWLAAGLAVCALALAACSEGAASGDSSGDAAATLEQIGDSERVRVRLKPGAEERLGIELAEVREVPGRGKAVPYAAVVYDASGDTWVYTQPTPRTYVRVPITIASIAGEDAFVSDGPEVGTEVVTVGTAELYGVEQEIGV
jgi:hypothetical protein